MATASGRDNRHEAKTPEPRPLKHPKRTAWAIKGGAEHARSFQSAEEATQNKQCTAERERESDRYVYVYQLNTPPQMALLALS